MFGLASAHKIKRYSYTKREFRFDALYGKHNK